VAYQQADGASDDRQTAHRALSDYGWALSVALYPHSPHAALAETVEGAVAIKRPQLKGLINGVLRQFQRQQEELLAEFAERKPLSSSQMAAETPAAGLAAAVAGDCRCEQPAPADVAAR
jgi:hypothetical protein